MFSEALKCTKVRTTLPKQPLPPNSERAPIKTARLVLRPFVQSDFDGVRALRTQPEVMVFTMTGRIDGDLSETQAKLDASLPPNDVKTFNFTISLSDTDELIGTGGVHKVESALGWPEVGYMFKREHWGKGYATEFMKGFVEAWWKLEREQAYMEVESQSIDMDGKAEEVKTVPELLSATIDANNAGSLRVLEKSGFKKFKTWTEPDARAGFEGMLVTLAGFVLRKETP
ncbi:putative GNAT domain-containing protein [Seiridium cardinale]|uniref:GNAT domain-containing protein n=1 Tax=Seiridium cardinale TaxID=138064 RepID=A0ABR2XNS1_9PEZI